MDYQGYGSLALLCDIKDVVTTFHKGPSTE